MERERVREVLSAVVWEKEQKGRKVDRWKERGKSKGEGLRDPPNPT